MVDVITCIGYDSGLHRVGTLCHMAVLYGNSLDNAGKWLTWYRSFDSKENQIEKEKPIVGVWVLHIAHTFIANVIRNCDYFWRFNSFARTLKSMWTILSLHMDEAVIAPDLSNEIVVCMGYAICCAIKIPLKIKTNPSIRANRIWHQPSFFLIYTIVLSRKIKSAIAFSD